MSDPVPTYAEARRAVLAVLDERKKDPERSFGRSYVLEHLNAISPHLKEQPVAISYLVEAIDTYNKGSVKACAVMLGCAAEALSLAMRDRLVAKTQANGGAPLANLHDWRIATVIRAMEQQLDGRVTAMPRDLRERYESYWSAWSGFFRMTRNEVGHPKSVDPVTREVVHAALLLFHEHARLMFDLGGWIDAVF